MIVGSLGHGNVSRIAPGSTVAEEWIKPGAGGLNGVLGVYADEKSKTLWVCSNNLENKGEAASAKAFDLKSGAPKGAYRLPGDGALCNDIAVATDGAAYFTDTRQGSVLMLKPGGKDLETILYVNHVTTGKLLRLDLATDGKSKTVIDLKLSRPLDRPDGMRAIGRNRLLLAENSGKMDIVTFEGPGMQNAVVKTIKEDSKARLVRLPRTTRRSRTKIWGRSKCSLPRSPRTKPGRTASATPTGSNTVPVIVAVWF